MSVPIHSLLKVLSLQTSLLKEREMEMEIEGDREEEGEGGRGRM